MFNMMTVLIRCYLILFAPQLERGALSSAVSVSPRQEESTFGSVTSHIAQQKRRCQKLMAADVQPGI